MYERSGDKTTILYGAALPHSEESLPQKDTYLKHEDLLEVFAADNRTSSRVTFYPFSASLQPKLIPEVAARYVEIVQLLVEPLLTSTASERSLRDF